MSSEITIKGLHLFDLPHIGREFMQGIVEYMVDQGSAQGRAVGLLALRTAPTLLWIHHDTEATFSHIVTTYDELFMLPPGTHVVDEVGFVWRKLYQFDDPAVRGWVQMRSDSPADEQGTPMMNPETPDFINSSQGPMSFGMCLVLDVPEGYYITFTAVD